MAMARRLLRAAPKRAAVPVRHSLVSRLLTGTETCRNNDRGTKPLGGQRSVFNALEQASITEGVGKSTRTLVPLQALGGLSLVNYMCLEATQGHFDMLRTWDVNVGKDLADALDRIEELEIMVNDLTSFVERQKEQLAALV